MRDEDIAGVATLPIVSTSNHLPSCRGQNDRYSGLGIKTSPRPDSRGFIPREVLHQERRAGDLSLCQARHDAWSGPAKLDEAGISKRRNIIDQILNPPDRLLTRKHRVHQRYDVFIASFFEHAKHSSLNRRETDFARRHIPDTNIPYLLGIVVCSPHGWSGPVR